MAPNVTNDRSFGKLLSPVVMASESLDDANERALASEWPPAACVAGERNER